MTDNPQAPLDLEALKKVAEACTGSNADYGHVRLNDISVLLDTIAAQKADIERLERRVIDAVNLPLISKLFPKASIGKCGMAVVQIRESIRRAALSQSEGER